MEENDNKGTRTLGDATDKCEHCGYEGNKQQVAMHAAKKHKVERKMNKYVLRNQCPLCETLLEIGKLLYNVWRTHSKGTRPREK
jgi:hypothetical protein